MKHNNELLKHIYKDASMATYTITTLLENLKDKNNKIKNTTEKILKDYQEFETKAKELLEKNDEEPKGEGMMTKMMSSMGVTKEVNKDNSDSAIADMLIKGISIGSIEMERKIKDYSKEVDKKILKLAEDFLEFQANSIEKLKEFL